MLNSKNTIAGVVGIVGAALLAPMVAYAQGGDTSFTRRPNGQYEARIGTDRTQYTPNRAVQITMTMTNLLDRTASIAPGLNTRPYDYWVRDSRSNRVVYTLSKHRQFDRNNSYTLAGGESRTFREFWDQRDDAGKAVPSGVYVIEARLWPQETVSTQIFLSDRGGGRPDPPSRPEPEPGPPIPGKPTPGNPDNPIPGKPGLIRLRSTLQADRQRYAPGQTMTLTYTVVNGGTAPAVLNFTSGKQFDMTATAPNGRKVWQWSEGRMFPMMLTTLRLAPGESKVYSATWQLPNNVPVGAYRLYAFLTPRDMEGAGAASATVRVAFGNVGGNDGNNEGEWGHPGRPNDPRPGRPVPVTLRDLINKGRNAVGQRVSVSGIYLGLRGGFGAPPVRRSDWVISSEGVSLYVSGPDPSVAAGRPVTVIGTVRRTNDGRLYLEAG